MKRNWMHPFTAGLCLTILSATAACGGTWTWTGSGADDKWSNTANWTPANFPTNSTTATNNLVFDGFTRLTPDQDLADPYYVVTSMVFSANSGAFVLGGLTNVLGANAWRSYQLSGSRPSVTVLGTSNILIKGAFNAHATTDTNSFNIPSNVVLQVPSISGSKGLTIAKNGPGLLRVYEDADGQYYTQAKSTVGPQWQINDGTVEMGTRTNCYIYNDSNKTNFILTTQNKGGYVVTVGDGIGPATSAVLRVIGQVGAICGSPVWTIMSDGLLDFNNIGAADTASTQPFLTISNGMLTRVGASGLIARGGAVIDLRGSARIEGTAPNSIWFYDTCTNLVDATGTRAVIASDARLVSGSTFVGVLFNVSNKPADVVSLEVTGSLGTVLYYGSFLVKRGAGTMSIMNLTHDANRTNRVEAGTLWVNGVSKPGTTSTSAQWLVLTNATLGGSGIISNATVWVQGGTLNPGTTNAAVFTVSSNVVFGTGAALTIDVTGSGTVAGTDYDQLLVKNGSVSGLANVALTVNVVGSPAVDNHTLRVINGGGNYITTGQSFQSLTLQGLAGRTLVPTYGNGFVDVLIKHGTYGTTVFFR